jgi:hypothetical protein
MDNNIEYRGTYYGIHHGGLKCMFADPTYLQLDDGASNDEDCNQDVVDEVNIVNFRDFKAMDEDNHFDNVNVLEGSSTPIDQALVRLQETMAKIIV